LILRQLGAVTKGDVMAYELTRRGPGRMARSAEQELSNVDHEALVCVRRIEAAAWVTHVGLTTVAMMSSMEGQLLQQVPLAEARLRAVVDTFTGVVAAEIAGRTFR
jgi:hypothetical protein